MKRTASSRGRDVASQPPSPRRRAKRAKTTGAAGGETVLVPAAVAHDSEAVWHASFCKPSDAVERRVAKDRTRADVSEYFKDMPGKMAPTANVAEVKADIVNNMDEDDDDEEEEGEDADGDSPWTSAADDIRVLLSVMDELVATERRDRVMAPVGDVMKSTSSSDDANRAAPSEENIVRGLEGTRRTRLYLEQLDSYADWVRAWYQREIHEEMFSMFLPMLYGSTDWSRYSRAILAFWKEDISKSNLLLQMARRWGKTASTSSGIAPLVLNVPMGIKVLIFSSAEDSAIRYMDTVADFIESIPGGKRHIVKRTKKRVWVSSRIDETNIRAAWVSCIGVTSSNANTSRGLGADLIVVEEISYTKDEVILNMVLPLWTKSGARFIGLGTQHPDPNNLFARMQAATWPDGSNVMNVYRVEARCPACVAARIHDCEHRRHLRPSWLSGDTKQLVKIMYECAPDGAAMYRREIEGADDDPVEVNVVSVPGLAQLTSLESFEFDTAASVVFVMIDPAFGGKASDVAIVSTAYARGESYEAQEQFIVVRFFVHSLTTTTVNTSGLGHGLLGNLLGRGRWHFSFAATPPLPIKWQWTVGHTQRLGKLYVAAGPRQRKDVRHHDVLREAVDVDNVRVLRVASEGFPLAPHTGQEGVKVGVARVLADVGHERWVGQQRRANLDAHAAAVAVRRQQRKHVELASVQAGHVFLLEVEVPRAELALVLARAKHGVDEQVAFGVFHSGEIESELMCVCACGVCCR
jgi:hypothetical protein